MGEKILAPTIIPTIFRPKGDVSFTPHDAFLSVQQIDATRQFISDLGGVHVLAQDTSVEVHHRHLSLRVRGLFTIYLRFTREEERS